MLLLVAGAAGIAALRARFAHAVVRPKPFAPAFALGLLAAALFVPFAARTPADVHAFILAGFALADGHGPVVLAALVLGARPILPGTVLLLDALAGEAFGVLVVFRATGLIDPRILQLGAPFDGAVHIVLPAARTLRARGGWVPACGQAKHSGQEREGARRDHRRAPRAAGPRLGTCRVPGRGPAGATSRLPAKGATTCWRVRRTKLASLPRIPPSSDRSLVEMTSTASQLVQKLPWKATPPPGWEPVAEIAAAVHADLEAVVARINGALRREIEGYGRGSVLTDVDLAWTTGRNTSTFLHSLAESRPATPEELGFRKLVGERSAQRGLSLSSLIASFHIAYRELWSELVTRAQAAGGAAPALLLSGGSAIWERLHATISAVAAGYAEELARRETVEMRATAALLDAIVADPSSEEVHALATELGFRADGAFRVVALIGPVSSTDIARALVAAITRRGGVAASAPRGRAGIVLVQQADDTLLDAALAELPDEVPVGVGHLGAGTAGARISLGEAEHALELATSRGGVVRYADEWLLTLAAAHRGSIEHLLGVGMRAGVAHPHLAETIRAFAEVDLSIAEGARRMRLSQNSFRYRLNRWQELTGWDPRSFDGLARSLTALALVDAPVAR